VKPYLAIDLGTSFLKGCVLNLDALEPGKTKRVPLPDRVTGLDSHFFELDPEDVLASVERLINELASDAPGNEVGLVLCAQMHGIVLLDSSGRPKTNIITWQDQRSRLPLPRSSGGETCLEWIERVVTPAQRRALGNELRPGIPIGTLVSLARQNPGWLDENLTVASLPDFVLSALAHTQAAVDATNAASYGLFDVERGTWQDDVITTLGLAGLRFPPIAGYRDTPYEFDLNGKTYRCHTPVGDHQCALGGCLLEPGELSLNISTGSQVSTLSESFRATNNYQVRPFFDGMFLHTATHIPAGRSLNALLGLLTELPRLQGTAIDDPWTLIAQVTKEDPPTASPPLEIDLSFFKSREKDAGSINGIREDNLNVGALFRAAFSSMVDDYIRHADSLPKPPNGWSRLVLSGGVAHKVEQLRQMATDRFQLPSRLSPTTEDTMFGLLVISLAATGIVPDVRSAMRLIESQSN
jgi:sugar (pentulose or hexulose) kinase